MTVLDMLLLIAIIIVMAVMFIQSMRALAVQIDKGAFSPHQQAYGRLFSIMSVVPPMVTFLVAGEYYLSGTYSAWTVFGQALLVLGFAIMIAPYVVEVIAALSIHHLPPYTTIIGLPSALTGMAYLLTGNLYFSTVGNNDLFAVIAGLVLTVIASMMLGYDRAVLDRKVVSQVAP